MPDLGPPDLSFLKKVTTKPKMFVCSFHSNLTFSKEVSRTSWTIQAYGITNITDNDSTVTTDILFIEAIIDTDRYQSGHRGQAYCNVKIIMDILYCKVGLKKL